MTLVAASASQRSVPRGTTTPMPAESLAVTLTTDKATYRSGEPIQLTLALVNRSDHDLVLEFATGQRYDFLITDRHDATVWRWSADRAFMQMLGTERLPPGGSHEYRAQFEGRLPPGTYTATGMIVARGSPLRAIAAITVR